MYVITFICMSLHKYVCYYINMYVIILICMSLH